jgi:hypothetical protein
MSPLIPANVSQNKTFKSYFLLNYLDIRRTMADAKEAAPKPLSILTTPIPEAQLFSILSKAANP